MTDRIWNDASSTSSSSCSCSFGKDEAIKIGGRETRGHVEEWITGNLLVLWRAPFCNWKPLPNCTGRYSCRETKQKQPPPLLPNDQQQTSKPTPNHHQQQQQQDVELIFKSSTNGDNDDYDTTAAVRPSLMTPAELMNRALQANQQQQPSGPQRVQQWEVQEFDPAPGRKDRILVLPLDSRQETGIITYVKQKNNDCSIIPSSSFRYVHTLNAPSGFQRKLEAVGIQLQRNE